MSIKLMTAIWEIPSSIELTGVETAILIKLADYASDDGYSVYPSLKKLSQRTRFSKSTVVRTIESLIDKKFISKVADYCQKNHQSNSYRINTELFYKGADSCTQREYRLYPERVVLRESSTHSEYRAVPRESIGCTHCGNRHIIVEPLLEPLLKTINSDSDDFSKSENDREHTQSSTEQKAIKEPKSRKQKQNTRSEQFSEWYAAYPLRKDPQAAIKAFEKALKLTSFETLLEAAKAYGLWIIANKKEDFIKYPATWLNKGCWEDEDLKPFLNSSELSVNSISHPLQTKEPIDPRILKAFSMNQRVIVNALQSASFRIIETDERVIIQSDSLIARHELQSEFRVLEDNFGKPVSIEEISDILHNLVKHAPTDESSSNHTKLPKEERTASQPQNIAITEHVLQDNQNQYPNTETLKDNTGEETSSIGMKEKPKPLSYLQMHKKYIEKVNNLLHNEKQNEANVV